MMQPSTNLSYYDQIANILKEWHVGGRGVLFSTNTPNELSRLLPVDEIEHIELQAEELSNFYYPDRRWNLIVVDRALEHMPNPWVVAEEIRTHLYPGGVAMFITSFNEITEATRGDYWRFTPEGLRLLCAAYADVVVGYTSDESHTSFSWIVARTLGVPPTPIRNEHVDQEDAALGGPWQIHDFTETGGDQWVEKQVCDYLVSSFAPTTALDLGCGAGLFVGYLNQRNVDAWGVEAADLRAIFPLPDKFIQRDLRHPVDLERQFDLVLCLEVAEHIDATFETTLFETLRRHSKRYLLFSAATLGQEGHGHINLHTEAYWFARLREFGYSLRIDATNICRALCMHPWYAKNMSFWELGTDETSKTDHTWLPELAAQPNSYVRRLEADYETLRTNHANLAASWEVQQKHIIQSEQRYNELLASWHEQQRQATELHNVWTQQVQHIAALEQRNTALMHSWQEQQQYIESMQLAYAELQETHHKLTIAWQDQQQHIADTEQRHTELLKLWEDQQQHIADMEQRHTQLIESWNEQHRYIEDMQQRHATLIEEWNKQRHYINQLMYKS